MRCDAMSIIFVFCFVFAFCLRLRASGHRRYYMCLFVCGIYNFDSDIDMLESSFLPYPMPRTFGQNMLVWPETIHLSLNLSFQRSESTGDLGPVPRSI